MSADARPHPVLRRHRLGYLPNLGVDPALFGPQFSGACSMQNCNARCCRDGVNVDPVEKRRILEHAEIIVRHMDPDQEKDPARWFDGVVEEDTDYPSGRCEGTRTGPRGCVFLNGNGWCVLQKAAAAEGMHKFAIKPFFCVAFPLTIMDGVLTIDDPEFTKREVCCSMVERGELAPADVCREELNFMLGPEGVNELDRLRDSGR